MIGGRNILLGVVVAVLAHFSCFAQSSRVSVEIEGWGDDSLAVYRLPAAPLAVVDGAVLLDKRAAEGGRFEFSLPEGDSAFVAIVPPGKVLSSPIGFIPARDRVEVWLAPGRNVVVRGRRAPDGVQYVRSGGAMEELWDRYDLETGDLQRRFDDGLLALVGAMYDAKKNGVVEREFAELWGSTLDSMRRLSSGIDAADEKYRLLSADVADAGPFTARLSGETRNRLLGKLETIPGMLFEMQRREYEKRREKDEALIREFAQDGKAPDFTLKSIDGGSFTLSSLEKGGKYIVLDFWGSWCAPCLEGMPEMKKMYERFGDRLEIVGIACRDGESNWKNAVARLDLPWIHVINDELLPEGDIAARYHIASYPTKIILAPDRTIVCLYSGELPMFYDKLNELLSR
jgi:thiol-disulfide isomerase/thioredoxin